MELIKDYDISILYNLVKANMMADALSEKLVSSMRSLAFLKISRCPLQREVWSLAYDILRLEETRKGRCWHMWRLGHLSMLRLREDSLRIRN